MNIGLNEPVLDFYLGEVGYMLRSLL